MAIIKCKMCGGDLALQEGSAVAQCEYCGTTQTVPAADDEKKLVLFERADRLRRQCEFDKAAGVYESIVADFRQEPEAYWGLVLCKYGIEYVDDPATGKKIPTCHRSSFESILDDSDYEQTLENADPVARRVYREEAKAIEELRKSIVEVSSKEEPYDIFICYKETDEGGQRTIDSVLAQDVYDALTEKGYRVFFSRITLEDKLGLEYEPYIFAALNSARIMLAFGTDYEYFNAVWVKNEWSRFLKLMSKDKGKHLIPCYKGIDAYDMPKEFSKLQAQDLGKVGAIQDLLRGIGKLIEKNSQPVSAATGSGSSDIIGETLQRAYSFLAAKDWQAANMCLDTVLGYDPRNSKALVGKLMCDFQVSKAEELGTLKKAFTSSKHYEVALKYADTDTAEKLKKANCQAICNLSRDLLLTRSVTNANIAVELLGTVSSDAEAKVLLQQAITFIRKRRLRLTVTIASICTVIAVLVVSVWLFASSTYPGLIKGFYSGEIGAAEAYSRMKLLSWYQKDPQALYLAALGSGEASDAQEISLQKLTLNQTTIAYFAARPNGLDVSNIKTIVVEDGTTDIPSGCFKGCTELQVLTLPNTITSFSTREISDCKALEQITLPGTTDMTEKAFYSYYKLKRVILYDGITHIEAFNFSNCKNLEDIVIPDSVTSIANKAFFNCESLKRIVIPISVTKMGSNVFSGRNKALKVYCEAPSMPDGWSSFWDDDKSTVEWPLNVVWGYTGE